MGQYSYSQPSSSDDYDQLLLSLLQEEAEIYADDGDNRQNSAEACQYQPQPEADDGIPTRCYCGSEPILATSYTRRDPGRRYYMCENAEDGECHIWKWWDVAVMEEMADVERQLRQLRIHRYESDQKLANLEETVWELGKKNSLARYAVPIILALLSVCLCLLVHIQWTKRLWTDLLTNL